MKVVLKKIGLALFLSFSSLIVSLIISFSFSPDENKFRLFIYGLTVGFFTVLPIYFLGCFILLVLKIKVKDKLYQKLISFITIISFLLITLNLFLFNIEELSYYLFILMVLSLLLLLHSFAFK